MYLCDPDQSALCRRVRLGIYLGSVTESYKVPTLCRVQGEHGRMVGQHELNKESSRSHAIFTLHLERSSGVGFVARDHAGSVVNAAFGSDSGGTQGHSSGCWGLPAW